MPHQYPVEIEWHIRSLLGVVSSDWQRALAALFFRPPTASDILSPEFGIKQVFTLLGPRLPAVIIGDYLLACYVCGAVRGDVVDCASTALFQGEERVGRIAFFSFLFQFIPRFLDCLDHFYAWTFPRLQVKTYSGHTTRSTTDCWA